jgi:hypothetical protein
MPDEIDLADWEEEALNRAWESIVNSSNISSISDDSGDTMDMPGGIGEVEIIQVDPESIRPVSEGEKDSESTEKWKLSPRAKRQESNTAKAAQKQTESPRKKWKDHA